MSTQTGDKLTLGVHLAGELENGMNRVGGWTPALVNALSKNDEVIDGVRDVILGLAEIKPIEHVIDLSADPFVPDGWSVEEHLRGKGNVKVERRGNVLFVGGREVTLFLSRKQQGGKCIEGHKLRKELSSKPVLNANLLDCLLANPHLIPEEWKGKAVFFWGTIYRDSDGHLCVRDLCWHDGRWRWGYDWLDDDWYDCGPALLFASPPAGEAG